MSAGSACVAHRMASGASYFLIESVPLPRIAFPSTDPTRS